MGHQHLEIRRHHTTGTKTTLTQIGYQDPSNRCFTQTLVPIDDTQKTQNVPKILEVIQKTYLGMYKTLPETGRNKGFQCFSIIYYYYHYYYYHLSSVVIMKQNK